MQQIVRGDTGAVKLFMDNLLAAQRIFKNDLGPGVDLMKLLKTYQDNTGIISTANFTVPEIPNDPGGPDSSFFLDLVEGIAGAASTEVGVGISLYTLVIDLVKFLSTPVHLRGILMNSSARDVTDIDFEFYWGYPNVLPLSRSLPGMKNIMNPVDKHNYYCAGLTFFGGVGPEGLQGVGARIRCSRAPMVFQYYTTESKGVCFGEDDRYCDFRWFERGNDTVGAMHDGGLLDTVAMFVFTDSESTEG